jgi:hypothetical protein
MGDAQEVRYYRAVRPDLARPGLRAFSRRDRPADCAAGARNSDRSANSHSGLVAYSASHIDTSSYRYPSANSDTFEPATYPYAHNAAANAHSYYSASDGNSPANSNPAANQQFEQRLPGRLALGVSH